MDYLQYQAKYENYFENAGTSFKPYYKWITFNTTQNNAFLQYFDIVLNLIINGLPSILKYLTSVMSIGLLSFKPYYKWITFNTVSTTVEVQPVAVEVLNLIINGLPSIPLSICHCKLFFPNQSFKPYYKWITFNTLTKGIDGVFMVERSLFYMVAKIEHFSVF